MFRNSKCRKAVSISNYYQLKQKTQNWRPSSLQYRFTHTKKKKKKKRKEEKREGWSRGVTSEKKQYRWSVLEEWVLSQIHWKVQCETVLWHTMCFGISRITNPGTSLRHKKKKKRVLKQAKYFGYHIFHFFNICHLFIYTAVKCVFSSFF